jgi:8-oxo-dGTP pyrophosphatase MutT (NUDIX family)
VDVAAILHVPDGRYLMQKRDTKPWLRVAGHWALFGGGAKPRENPKAALFRELEEELCFRPRSARPFAEMTFGVPQLGVSPRRKVFFDIPIRRADMRDMELREGETMALFALNDLIRQRLVVPWDAYGLFLHARQDTTFRPPVRPARRHA